MTSRHVTTLIYVAAACTAVVAMFFAIAPARQRRQDLAEITDLPLVKLASDTHDFGVILPSTAVNHVFTSKNPLPQTIFIDALHKSCGCTLAKIDKTTIDPGGSFTVACILTGRSYEEAIGSTVQAVGHTQTQRVAFEYQLRATTLRTIKPANTASEDIDLGSWTTADLPAHAQVTMVRGKYPLAFDSIQFECDSSALTGEVKALTPDTWLVSFVINPEKRLGPVGIPVKFQLLSNGKLLAESDSEQVYFEIRGPILASPPSLYLGLSPGEKAERKIEIKSRDNISGGLPPRLIAVSTTSKNAAVRGESNEDGSFILLDYTAPAAGMDRGQIIATVGHAGATYDIAISYLAAVAVQ
jgi:hypothetical protein